LIDIKFLKRCLEDIDSAHAGVANASTKLHFINPPGLKYGYVRFPYHTTEEAQMFHTTDFAPIAALDFSAIKAKLMHKAGEGWSLERADAVEREYRRFLLLMKVFPNEQTAPLVDVDTFWHYHILDTMKYAVDSEQVFGYFLHHYPYVGMGGEDDEQVRIASGERMRELYEATFAEAYPVLRADRTDIQASAYCTSAVTAQTAFCGSAVTAQTAFCGSAVTAQTAFCGSAVTAQTAFCGASGKAQTAFCGASGKAQTAFCGAAVTAQTAFCGAAVKAQTAFCGAAIVPATGKQTAEAALAA
jgi:hypothetical protein